VQLKKKGNDLVGCCPFHDDDTPSLVVTPSKNLWHCIGACQRGGSVIDWVVKSRGVSFRHAVELLQEDHPSLAADPTAERRGGRQRGVVPVTSHKRPLADGFCRSVDDDALLVQVVDFYHQSLKQPDKALGYLDKRGLGDAKTLEHFRVGFADRRLGYRLPNRARRRARRYATG
jgi:DNA primase